MGTWAFFPKELVITFAGKPLAGLRWCGLVFCGMSTHWRYLVFTPPKMVSVDMSSSSFSFPGGPPQVPLLSSSHFLLEVPTQQLLS